MSSGTCRIQQPPFRLQIALREVLAFSLLALVLVKSSSSLADDALPYPDWAAASRVKTIRLVTQDAGGVSRDDKLWFVVIDGAAYLRTGEPPWVHNLRREPNAEVWLSKRQYAVRAEEVQGAEIIEQVEKKLREGYGRLHRIARAKIKGTPTIIRLGPRD